MTSSLTEKLVEMRGIESNYTDAWGNPATINEDSKTKLLKAMGYQTHDDAALEKQVDEEVQRAWMTPLNPVQVNRVTDDLVVPVRLPIELVNDVYNLVITTEQGDEQRIKLVPSESQLINVAHFELSEFQEYLVSFDAKLPLGYHNVSLEAEDGEALASMRLIIAPSSCYHPNSISQGNKVWGLSVQLYCVRSDRNWGVGDFTDLAYLLENAAKQGAQFVGLNPIHALYPANPDACSPYGPSSRRWLNFIYLDVTAIEGYETDAVNKIITDETFQSTLEHARNVEYVDYEAVTRLKLQALEAVFEYQYDKYLSKNTKQNKAFKAFVKEGGDSLEMLAVYDAIQASLAKQGKPSWGWPVFPEEYAEFQSPAVAKFKKQNAKQVKFFLFLQWQAALQLENANEVASKNNMEIGLYRDLAVGVSEGSAEIWGNRDLYSIDASVGAPPDILGPLGQNWGASANGPAKAV